MKHLAIVLMASTIAVSGAQAADIVFEAPVEAVPAPMAPIASPVLSSSFDWTGGYVGAFGGVGTSETDLDGFVTGPTIDPSRFGGDASGGGGLIGAQAGYDYQLGDFVVGVVADIAKTNVKSDLYGYEVTTVAGLGSAEETIDARSKLDYVGTVRGRLGYAMDRFMVYGHAGFAYGETKQNLSTGLVLRDAAGTVTFRDSEGFRTDSGTKTGYSVGAGLEYAVFDNVSFQTEYGYTDLGTDTILNVTNGTTNTVVREELDFHTIKAGVNFRF